MADIKAVDKTNLQLALSENNKKVKKYVDDSHYDIKKYQKYVNTELDYCYLELNSESTNNINIVTDTVIPFNVFKNGNIEYNTENCSIKLKAGKTYEINANYVMAFGMVNNAIFDITNNINIKSFVTISTKTDIDLSPSDGVAIYTPSVDCEIQVKAIWASDSCKLDYNNPHGYFIVKEINRQITIDPVEYINEEQGIEDTPVGHIISHMGTIAPKHYLVCDGSEYNIADYPYLAQHIKDNFGRINCFGGDNKTTFAVPNLIHDDSRLIENENISITLINNPSIDVSHFIQPNVNEENFVSLELPHTYEIQFSSPKRISKYGLLSRSKDNNDTAIMPQDFEIQAFDEETLQWIVLDNQNGQTYKANTTQYYKISKPSFYSKYRLYITSNTSQNTELRNYIQIGYMSFYEEDEIQIPCIKYEPTYFMNINTPLVGRSETVLFEGNYSTSCNANMLTTGTAISDSIENYDELYFETIIPNAKTVMNRYAKPNIFIERYGITCFEISEFASTSFYSRISIGFIDNSTIGIGYVNNKGWDAPYLSKIIGIKYQQIESTSGESYTDEEINQAINDIIAEINTEKVIEGGN